MDADAGASVDTGPRADVAAPDTGPASDATTPPDLGTDTGGPTAPDSGLDMGPEADAGPPDQGMMQADTGPRADGGCMAPDYCAGVTGACQVVSSDITTNTTWVATTTYVLTRIVYVGSPGSSTIATLTIPAGTRILGAPSACPGQDPGALVITRFGRIDANGSAANPIVFTTAATSMRSLRANKWGGLALLGRATHNRGASATLEGLVVGDPRALFGPGNLVPAADGGVDAGPVDGGPDAGPADGGPDAGPAPSTDDWNCGRLRYVRIEFASFELSSMRELNGLTIGGCGTQTDISFVQVHQADDDGVEIFGGTNDIKNIIITGAQDDGLDYDWGWRGRGQFIVVQAYRTGADGTFEERAVEADSGLSSGVARMPITNPQLYNVTLIGPRNATLGPAIAFRSGLRGEWRNTLIAGFGRGWADVVGADTALNLRGGTPTLTFRNGLILSEGGTLVDTAAGSGASSAADTVRGIAEYNELVELMTGNVYEDPPVFMPGNTFFDRAAPNWVPAVGTTPDTAAAATPPSGGFFDTTATYIGAFNPGGTNWAANWTAFPAN